MSRCLLILGVMLAAVIGCESAPDAPPSPSESGKIDYTGWPELTKGPVPISEAMARTCESFFKPQVNEKNYGPHFVHSIRIYANDVAAPHLREDRAGPLPIGATIIKEKWQGDTPPLGVAYAAMIKREAGYDPEHGDWEYVYVRLGEQENVDRGKLQACIDCHRRAKTSDYLFRTQLKYPN